MKKRIFNLTVLLLGCFALTQVAQAGPVAQTSNVNVVNTPNVNVANTPSVTLSGTPNVNISNSPIIQDRDNPARHPFTYNDGSQRLDGLLGVVTVFVPQVPAGKRLVIEQVSVIADLNPSAAQKLYVNVTTGTGGGFNYYGFTGTDTGLVIAGTTDRFVASSQMRCYEDAGNSAFVTVDRSDVSAPGGGVNVNVSGYLIDIP